MRLILCMVVALFTAQVNARIPAHFEQSAAASDWAVEIQQARVRIGNLMQTGAPGISVAIAVDGEIIWAEGFGYANVEHNVAVTPLTKFRVGSVSKAMTTIAMARLYEREQLDLDAPIQTYLPNFPQKTKGPISARQLASHRAGIRSYRPDFSDYIVHKHYETVAEGLELFADDPLLYAPGSAYTYSSHGFNLLSAVVEAAAGTPFLQLMRSSVWGPLKLSHTVADHTDLVIQHRAAAYHRNEDGKLVNAVFTDNSYKWAGGGFLSTPSDVVRFGFGAIDGSLVRAETFDMLTREPQGPDGQPVNQGYGLGWFIYDNGWVGHSGGSVGGTAYFQIHPEHRVAVAVSCNLGMCWSDTSELDALRDIFVAP